VIASRPTNGSSLYELIDDEIEFDFHDGQERAWESESRIVAVLAGTQAGKTIFGPWWLAREIEDKGPGDYIAVTSTFDLFKLKMLPAIREAFEHVSQCGRYWAGNRIMEIADPNGRFLAKNADDPMWARIILRSAESGGGLESGTAKAAWLDEAGQKNFTLETWQAILRRLSLSMGRLLLTTTLYNFGYLKTEVYDRWKSGNPGYEVINFRSIDNPVFPREEWERAKREMQPWLFAMQYEGRYERPAGLIYDSFIDDYRPVGHKCPRFAIPSEWDRYLGLDFGGVNTAGLWYANEPGTSRYYLYREYPEQGRSAAGRTAKEHVRELRRDEPFPVACVGGSPSEEQWRDEFKAAGLPVMAPDQGNVEVGIGRVYGAHRRSEIIVFDDLHGYLNQKRSYSRVLDSSGQPTEEIEHKNIFHYMDAERYVIGWINRVDDDPQMEVTTAPELDRRWGVYR
jgi:hypothetical protein